MINDPSKDKLLEIKVISDNLYDAIINSNRTLRPTKGRIKIKDRKVYLVFPDKYYNIRIKRSRNMYTMTIYNNPINK